MQKPGGEAKAGCAFGLEGCHVTHRTTYCGILGRATTWIGRMSMSLMCRGRITAHAAVICATVCALSLAMPRPAGAAYATDSTQSNLSMPQTSSPASADVLLMSAAEPQAVDIQWALYDRRQMLPDIAAQNDALPVSAFASFAGNFRAQHLATAACRSTCAAGIGVGYQR